MSSSSAFPNSNHKYKIYNWSSRGNSEQKSNNLCFTYTLVFLTKERFSLSGYLCNFFVRFWTYTEAICENPRRVTLQRGKQMIYISFKIDPNLNELLLEIRSLRQITLTAAPMGILQEILIDNNLDRTLLWPDIAILPLQIKKKLNLTEVFKLWKKFK